MKSIQTRSANSALNRCAFHNARRLRGGITLMEVLFAIAIILAGLGGLAVVVRFAMRNAVDTIRMDEAIQEGASAGSIASGQGLANFDRMVIVTDDRFDIASSGPLGPAATQSGRMRLATHVRLHNPALGGTGMLYDPVLPSTASQTTADTGMIDSPGFRRLAAPNVIQLDRFSGFCIDPLGFFRNFTVIDNAGTVTSTNALDPVMAHRIGVFPYYKPDWNPLQTPWRSFAIPAPTTMQNSQLGFPVPRLWRCQIARGNSEDMIPYHVVGTDVLDQSAAARLFQFPGNPSVKTVKDKSYAAARLFGADSTSMTPIQSANADRFTWFATLTPSVSASTVFNQAIVIVENRTIDDLYSNVDPAQVSQIVADDAPRGERLAWVYNAIGFDGGAGGEVSIVANDALSSRLRTGQWVMLSRQDYNFNYKVSPPVRQGTVTVPVGPAQHAWYRVLNVEEIPTPSTYPWDMPTMGSCWAKRLTLAGPDWQFNFETPVDQSNSSLTMLADDTVMTIIDGAVEVIQSQVILE